MSGVSVVKCRLLRLRSSGGSREMVEIEGCRGWV